MVKFISSSMTGVFTARKVINDKKCCDKSISNLGGAIWDNFCPILPHQKKWWGNFGQLSFLSDF
jgi:hypothetical protein